MILLHLFFSFLKIGFLGFGGGYAFLPLIQEETIKQGYLSASEFANLLALAEMTPGPLALNTASYVGMKTAGLLGGLIASVSVSLPGLIVCVLMFWLMNLPHFAWWKKSLRGLRPTLAALIVAAAVKIFSNDWPIGYFNLLPVGLLFTSIFFYHGMRVHPAIVVLGAGLSGAVLYYLGIKF